MRFTAVFAVVFTTALLTMGSTAGAQPLPAKDLAFVEKVLLTPEGGVLNPQPASSTTESDAASTDTESKDTTTEPALVEEPKDTIVTVQQGDTLSKIAKAHDTTWVRMYDANESISDPNVINPGQELRVPDADEELAHRETPVVKVASAQTAARATTAAQPAASYPVSSNAAKAFIYAHESGNNPNATNPNGCYGIGQDCNGVLRTMCGADYACQDAYFTRYAMGRYGSWEAAYAFWQANHWW